MKKYVFILFAVVVLYFIWHNSLQPANLSEQQSLIFAQIAQYLLQGTVGLGFPLYEADHIIRKLAHMTEFAMLGGAVFCAMRQFRLRRGRVIFLSLLLGLLAACVDEFLQQFSPGRAMQLSDVGIDFAGVCLGSGLAARFLMR